MNKSVLTSVVLTAVLWLGAAAPLTAQVASARFTASPETRERVDALLARMTLEEKVGQMTQVTLTTVAAEGEQPLGRVRLDAERLREAVVNRHVGSILNVVGSSLSVEGWHELITQIQDVATRETRLGIPIVYGVDFVHGANYTRGGTIFPHNLGLAATFNRQLARESGVITGVEALASGLPWNFAPVLDVGRQPLWPRLYETFGESPYLVTELGREVLDGMQESGRVAATLKHYLGYGEPRTGRDRTPAMISRRAVREYHLPPFRAAIEAGAMTVMVNSGEIDGEPVHASRYWLTDVLRGELGFEGVVVTDWEDVNFLHTRHLVAPTLKEAVRIAVDAGIDMSMTPHDFDFAVHLAELVREGAIAESRVDESVRRILTLKAELGLLDQPYPDPAFVERFAAPASVETARRAARESITLLKNDGLLPLRRDARILVTGPAAQSLSALNGGWTYTWQGVDVSALPAGVPTVLDAVRARSRNVTYVRGSGFSEVEDLRAATRAAARADVAIVVLGEEGYAEWIGDIDDLTLPEAQLRLAEAVQATGTPTILVLLQGRPRVIHRIEPAARAVVMAYWPGMEGAEAVAGALFGEFNPGGRLPITYPRYPNALLTYDHKFPETLDRGFNRATAEVDVQYPLGHGLSYTTFSYSDLRLSDSALTGETPLTVEVTVTNTGSRAGDDAVLLFTRQHYARLTPHVRRLRGFERISLEPGASRTVSFTLGRDHLTYVAQDGEEVLEPGRFDVMVGDLSATFEVVAR